MKTRFSDTPETGGPRSGDGRPQYRILAAIGLRAAADPPDDAELVPDALLGYSQRGPVTGAAAELVEWTRGRR